MNSLNFPDVNVWIALIWQDHDHSEAARLWFQKSADEQFFFCRFAQMSVLRLLTTASVMAEDVQTNAGAWNLWNRIAADERITFVGEPDGLEPHFRKASRLPTRSPKVWADSYLVAFARSAGLKLVTFDRALKDRGAEVLVL